MNYSHQFSYKSQNKYCSTIYIVQMEEKHTKASLNLELFENVINKVPQNYSIQFISYEKLGDISCIKIFECQLLFLSVSSCSDF